MKDALTQVIEKLETMHELLRQERASVLKSKPEITQQVVAQKEACLTDIETQTHDLISALAEHGHDFNLEGFKKYIGNAPKEEQGELITLFNRLKKMLKKAVEENTMNNTIVHNRLRGLNAKMDAITGRQSNLTYGPKGSKQGAINKKGRTQA